MYALYASNEQELAQGSRLFTDKMEPMLVKLEHFYRSGGAPAHVSEIPQYLEVCRWPFRRLEYSFALDALVGHLKPGDTYLDAGSGATPFAFVVAAGGVEAYACDGDARLIGELSRLPLSEVYGASVSYAAQDLTRTSYKDEMFDAISCISVLEHIPAPDDQKAIRELLRILKPEGLLVLTVDFQPSATGATPDNRLVNSLRRAGYLFRHSGWAELLRAATHKAKAAQVVLRGEAHRARSANQCFEIAHLEEDLIPAFGGQDIPSLSPCTADLRSVTAQQALGFWRLGGLQEAANGRIVLPAACIVRKRTILSNLEADAHRN
jgi:ubiquinone/menaquinone biosynthesis C-methylase UbiE